MRNLLPSQFENYPGFDQWAPRIWPDESAILPELRTPIPPAMPPGLPVDAAVQRSLTRAQTIADHWRTKIGTYTVTDEGLGAGGRSGKAIGGTYTDINERRAANRVTRMEKLAKQGALSPAEIAEIDADLEEPAAGRAQA